MRIVAAIAPARIGSRWASGSKQDSALDAVAVLAEDGDDAEVPGRLRDAATQVCHGLPQVEHRHVGQLHQLGFEVLPGTGQRVEAGGAERPPASAQTVDRGFGDLVARPDAHGDQLAAAHPSVGGLVVDSEALGGFLEVHRAPMRSCTRELTCTGRQTLITQATLVSRWRTATRWSATSSGSPLELRRPAGKSW